MNPILDQIIVALIVAGALAYLAGKWVVRRHRKAKSGCGSGCCPPTRMPDSRAQR
ncbi:MAG TPA: FeoB-associated Cys-rich membrane protein [Chthoniobacteraceae bacterium]|nr:FeoB-associated Cys-rich membrane protein [Chthoniobacteraceae bacterium]